ncbi:hypothetical protein Flexsi_1260 [Flexistipes sinusarabici DSM 4947]|uniref:Uncharacterized protein n=1 Tax=Flexistipes sinusarabici (strain ATCC 49648 / DSM 4947 / MAS 10) TaxID=717231 RepID=F8E751_FLESM|nr:hypothetical protein [Flexistipes sinusarabici]AEI14914.1 hypothetical protein Flexsi_1260 [Flexistipes sinusarabici DSM 4947]
MLYYNLFIFLFALLYSIVFVVIVLLSRKGKFEKYISVVSKVYKGFDTRSSSGILKGAVWAFVDGIITAVIVLSLYMLFK